MERYFDASKSAMLFAKAALLVEGIAERLVVPAFAMRNGHSFDEHHVAVVRVDGMTFKHFLPLFGADIAPELSEHSLHRQWHVSLMLIPVGRSAARRTHAGSSVSRSNSMLIQRL